MKIYKTVIFAAVALVMTSIASLMEGPVSAQPACEWDCMTMDCCKPGVEKPCNGGSYPECPDACVGAGAYEMPLGTCPY